LTAPSILGYAKNLLEEASGDGIAFNKLCECGYDPVAFDISSEALKTHTEQQISSRNSKSTAICLR
jgi:hypothetical protein